VEKAGREGRNKTFSSLRKKRGGKERNGGTGGKAGRRKQKLLGGGEDQPSDPEEVRTPFQAWGGRLTAFSWIMERSVGDEKNSTKKG